MCSIVLFIAKWLLQLLFLLRPPPIEAHLSTLMLSVMLSGQLAQLFFNF